MTAPGYTIPERGARFAGGDVVRLAAHGARASSPTSTASDDDTWERTAILWLNYPNNPTGRRRAARVPGAAPPRSRAATTSCSRSTRRTARCGSTPGRPLSALSWTTCTNVVALNTLSKRSYMTGYRSGFVAGDPQLIAALKSLRPSTGVTPQEFVQRASVAAWRRRIAREEQRARYAAKRAIFLELFAAKGIEVAGSVATFYLWVAVPGGRPSLAWALELLDLGIVVAPGSFFGPEGEGYVRMAMVPTIEDCRRAVDILAGALADRGGDTRERERHADLAARIEASFDAEDVAGRTSRRSRRPSACSTAARCAWRSRRTRAGS